MIKAPLDWKYSVIERQQVGLVLTGEQVKQFASNKVSIVGSRVVFQSSGSGVITGFSFHGVETQESIKILAHKKQLVSWQSKGVKNGMTWMVAEVEQINGKFKAIIALCKGKKLQDVRADSKAKTVDKMIANTMKTKVKSPSSYSTK